MSKKVISGFVAGLGIVAIAALGQAQNMPSSPGKADAPMGSKSSTSNKKANGEVTSVDAKSGKLMVKTATEELTLDVQASAPKKSLANIKVGDKVNVSYQDKGGMLVASAVTKAAASSKDGKGSSTKDSMKPSTKENMGSSTK